MKKISRRDFMKATAAMAATVGLSACGSASSTAASASTAGSTGAATSTGEKVKLVIHLNGMDEDIKMQKAMEDIVKEDQFANVEFDFHHRESDFLTAVPVAIAGGEQVDVLIVANPILFNQYAEEGMIVPLDDLFDEIGIDPKEQYGQYAENATYNGEIYMVPHNITRWALYYNKALFDAAGEPYPDLKVPMTWDEYQEVAKRVSSGEGADKIYGAFYYNWVTDSCGEALVTLGGGEKFYDADGMSNIEDPAFAHSMERVYKMMYEDGSMMTHPNAKTSQVASTDIMNGKYAMGLAGAWVLPWMADKTTYPRDYKMGIAPVPVESGTTPITWGIVNGFGISPTSVDPVMALRVTVELCNLCAKYADSAEEADRTVKQDTLFEMFKDDLADDDISVDDMKEVFTREDLVRVTEKITGKNCTDYQKVYMEEVDKYLSQEQDLDTTIANIKTRGNKAIQGE